MLAPTIGLASLAHAEAGAPQAALAASGALEAPGARMTTWDLDLNVGYGRRFAPDPGGSWAARARAGVLFIREPRFYALGVTAHAASDLPAAFGVEAEYLSTEAGVWVAPGVQLDVAGHPGASLAAGFSVLGVSAQLRRTRDGDTSTAALLTVRLPVRLLWWAVAER